MYNHYKDIEPEETIQKIRNIFNDLNIEVEESWLNPVDNLYSLGLVIVNTPLYSNGKGTSEEFARASAYAELIERIQNGIIFRLLDNYNLILQEVGNTGKRLNILGEKEAIDYIGAYLDLYEKIDDKKKREILMLFSLAMKNFKFQEPIIYKNIKGEEICLPSLFCDLYYGSNGIAAGNTKYEALTQALCEVMERYTVKKVLQEELKKCSDITSHVKETIKVFNETIEEIENTGLIIKFLDMSIETNLPVVMSVLIDLKQRKYFINCASHSTLTLAIERTMTETFQGRTLDEISKHMTPITANCINKTEDNLHAVFINGEGVYPINMLNFQDMTTHIGSIWGEFESITSNKQISEMIIDKIEQQGFVVYIADFSHCGFPSYQVIVPGMSEVTNIMETSALEKLNYRQEIKLILSKEEPSRDEILKLVNYFTNYSFPENYILKDFYSLPLMQDSNTSLDALDINLLLSILYGYLEDFNNAKKNIAKYNEKLSILCDDEDTINYYIVIENVFNLLSQDRTNLDIINILSTFFDESIVKEVLHDISKENILQGLPKINCIGQQGCGDCELKEECSFNSIVEIISRIK